jgi:hypothetical protein
MTISTRKFYDTASKFTIGGSLEMSDVMPTGDDNNSDTPAADTDDKPEDKKDAEPADKKPEGKKTDQTAGVEGKDDKTDKSDTTDKPDATAKPEATTAKPAATPTDWKSEVRKQKKEDVLKELGYDEHVIKMLNYRETNHDLTPFLKATTANWDKVSDLDLAREELRAEHLHLSEEDFNSIADDLLSAKYFLESVDDREKNRGKILLKSDAAKYRAKRKEDDKNFLDNVAKPAEKAAQPSQAEIEAQAQQQRDVYAAQVAELPASKKLLSEKQIVTASGFNYKVDPQAVLKVAQDPAKLFELFQKDGKEDWEGLFATIAFAMDRNNYDKLLTDHGKTLGGKEVDDELDGADQPEKKSNPGKKETLAQALEKRGVEFTL